MTDDTPPTPPDPPGQPPLALLSMTGGRLAPPPATAPTGRFVRTQRRAPEVEPPETIPPTEAVAEPAVAGRAGVETADETADETMQPPRQQPPGKPPSEEGFPRSPKGAPSRPPRNATRPAREATRSPRDPAQHPDEGDASASGAGARRARRVAQRAAASGSQPTAAPAGRRSARGAGATREEARQQASRAAGTTDAPPSRRRAPGTRPPSEQLAPTSPVGVTALLSRVFPRAAAHLERLARRWLLVLAFASLALLCGLAVLVAEQGLALLDRPPSVVVTRAEAAVIESSPGGVGTAGPAPGLSFAVSIRLDGVGASVPVEQIDVLNGSRVAAGAPLIRLNPLPIEQNVAAVELQLAQAQSTLAGARIALANARDSASAGYLSVQVPLLAGDVAIDEQLLQIARGNPPVITAPFSGTVTSLRVQPGDIVRDGETVLELVRTSELLVSAGVQLDDLAEVQPGDAVDVSLAAVAGVDLHGKVLTVSPQATGDGLEGTVSVLVPNDPGSPVPLGSQVFVRIVAPVRAAVAVPALAVFNLEIDPAVYVVSDGRVVRRPVEVGADDGNRIQILSGLRDGEQVALSNTQTLVDGEAVRTEPERD